MKRKTIDIPDNVFETIRREAFGLSVSPKKLIENILYHYDAQIRSHSIPVDFKRYPLTIGESYFYVPDKKITVKKFPR